MATPRNTQFSISLHALLYLAGAGAGRVVASDELARSIATNPAHLRRVMAPLREAGLVDSTSGRAGGWTLARPSEEISVADVWQPLQNGESLLGVHPLNPDCEIAAQIQGAIERVADDASETLVAQLSKTSLAELVSGDRAGV